MLDNIIILLYGRPRRKNCLSHLEKAKHRNLEDYVMVENWSHCETSFLFCLQNMGDDRCT
jgi:hypothetical protein